MPQANWLSAVPIPKSAQANWLSAVPIPKSAQANRLNAVPIPKSACPSFLPPTASAMSPGPTPFGLSIPSTVYPNSRLATGSRSFGTKENMFTKSTKKKPAPPSPTTPPISFSTPATSGTPPPESSNTPEDQRRNSLPNRPPIALTGSLYQG